MYTIGEFSKITGLTVKTLRFYHEQGVLQPSCVDEETGYRYYDAGKLERARVIGQLRQLEFPLADIAEILRDHADEGDMLDYLQRHKQLIEDKLAHYRQVKASLDTIISSEQEARSIMVDTNFEVQEKQLETLLIAGVRMRGCYGECGKGFAAIGRRFGRHICGKPMLLHYDCEYKEKDADFEACMPVRSGTSVEGITVRELPGGRCVALLHQGPYDELGRSYKKILDYIKQKGYQIEVPSREVYLKGPGMIFRGNPKKYLTEIQMVISPS